MNTGELGTSTSSVQASQSGPGTGAERAKSCCWSVTINNPTADDYQQWESLKGLHWVRTVDGQIEKGEEGTTHIQGMVRTESVRFAQMKKALPRAHIEAARQPAALAKYVAKEDTRVSALPSTKVATQLDIQKRILEMTWREYLTIGGEETTAAFYGYLLTQNVKSKVYAECLIDAAVKQLILEGYFGIEFVMCNPQVRLAFKKYFCEIIIRQYAASQVPTQTQSSEETSSTSQTNCT